MPAKPIEVNASRTTRINTASEIMAALCRKNRRRTSWPWVRATIAKPCAAVPLPVAAGAGGPTGFLSGTCLESVLIAAPAL